MQAVKYKSAKHLGGRLLQLLSPDQHVVMPIATLILLFYSQNGENIGATYRFTTIIKWSDFFFTATHIMPIHAQLQISGLLIYKDDNILQVLFYIWDQFRTT